MNLSRAELSSWLCVKATKISVTLFPRQLTLRSQTHNVALASPIANFIVSVSADGVATGRGQDLSSILESNLELQAEFRKEQQAISEDALIGSQADLIDKLSEKDKQKAGKLILAEEVQTGSVSWKSFKILIQAMGGNHPVFFVVAWTGVSVLEFAMHSLRTWFMGYWGSQYDKYPIEQVPVARYVHRTLGCFDGVLISLI